MGRTTLNTQIDSLYADNNTGAISEGDIRTGMKAQVLEAFNKDDDTTTNIVEGNKLFHTNQRVDSRIAPAARQGNTTDKWPVTKLDDTVVVDSDIADFQTAAEVNQLIGAADTGFKTTDQASTTTPNTSFFYYTTAGGARRRISLANLRTLLAPSTPTPFQAPAITAFSISGFSSSSPPNAGDNIGGSRTVSRTVTNTGNIQGALELDYRIGSGVWIPIATNLSC